MPNSFWQERIRRAEHLAAQHPFSAEILGFYIHTARFQGELYQHLERATGKTSGSQPDPGSREIVAEFSPFLSLVEKHGPARLAQIAGGMRDSSSSWPELLTRCWTSLDPPAYPADFLATAFLQPYAELARSHALLQLEGYTHSLCPFCNRKPSLGVLRPQGDGARRSLLCGFCLTEWEYRRIVCPGCGQENHAQLPVFTGETFPYIRIECCDSCHTYIKSIDLSKNGLAIPVVDELAALPLDLWAQEHGYTKLRPNLLGM